MEGWRGLARTRPTAAYLDRMWDGPYQSWAIGRSLVHQGAIR